jgi:hypothetical protein
MIVTNEYHIDRVEFPSVCVDNFFENPDLIRDYALSLPYNPTPKGMWPGFRTIEMSKFNPRLQEFLFGKILSCYYDLKVDTVSWKDSEITFTKIPHLGRNKDSVLNQGWIHTDEYMDFAGLIYLTPNAYLESGTSLYNLKEEYSQIQDDAARQPAKEFFYLGNKIDENIYKRELDKTMERFYEKTRFFNIYNRMICYDAHEYHRPNNMYAAENEDRLTLVFFLKGITVKKTPKFRVRDNVDMMWDEKIVDAMKKNENTKI